MCGFTRHLVISAQGQREQLAEALGLHHALGANNRRAYGVRQRHDEVREAPRLPLLLARPEYFVSGVHRQRKGELEQQERVVAQVVKRFQLVRGVVLILANQSPGTGQGRTDTRSGQQNRSDPPQGNEIETRHRKSSSYGPFQEERTGGNAAHRKAAEHSGSQHKTTSSIIAASKQHRSRHRAIRGQHFRDEHANTTPAVPKTKARHVNTAPGVP